MQTKPCPRCKLEVPTFIFRVSKKTGNPIGYCPECTKLHKAESYLRNRDSVLEKVVAYAGEHKESIKIYQDSYRESHREVAKSREKARRTLQGESSNAKQRERRKNDPEFKAREKVQNALNYVKHTDRMKMDPDYAANHKERARGVRKAWYARNQKSILARAAEKYSENPEAGRERSRKSCAIWRKKYPERVAAWNSFRKALNRSGRSQGFVEADHFEHLESWQLGRCYYCNDLLNFRGEKEHIVPVSNRGGSHSAQNLVLSCTPCNYPKKDERILGVEWVPDITPILNLEVLQDEVDQIFGVRGCIVVSSFLASSRNLPKPKNWMEEFAQENLPIFFDLEWRDRRSAVENTVWNRLNKPLKRTYARHCTVEEVSLPEAQEFLNMWHIQGWSGASIYLGLRDRAGDLVGMASWRDSENSIELSRLAFHGSVPGGFSKLVSHFIREYRRPGIPIISFCDPRYSGNGGNSYSVVGFEDAGLTSAPVYYYVGPSGMWHRRGFQKSLMPKFLDFFDQNLSEEANARANGFYRLYGVPQRRFLLR